MQYVAKDDYDSKLKQVFTHTLADPG
jgi:hypothetical protein